MTISTPRIKAPLKKAGRITLHALRGGAASGLTAEALAKAGSGGTGGRSATRRHAFTLVEVMVAATISTFILAGVLSAFLMVGRSGFIASSYSELEAQTRRALEIFGEDARKSADIRWNSSQSITLYVTTSTAALAPVTFAFDADRTSATYGSFYRVRGEATSSQPRHVLLRNVAPDFAFERFKLERGGNTENAATTDLETKQIQVTMRANRTGATTVAASQSALSARYILRNKRVSN